ncbi:MAG: BREX-1 system adenine-specific DNA-methyltransferase PglX [Planctomycetes bacterium]|nr:BREX-1 system adenine-specific DNA-methyltransferase PglX [Planctomycetota bacterium]
MRLIDISGPFLSLAVLERAFPQGLEAHDAEHSALLRRAYGDWEESQGSGRADPAVHRQWVRFVLLETLALGQGALAEGQRIPQALAVAVPEHGETLRPDFAVVTPPGGADAGKVRLLVQVLPSGQDLEKPLPAKRWNASSATRMMELLQGTEVRLGLVTNGEQWMLVSATRGETTGFATWHSHLWIEEPATLRAFRTLLGAHRFFSAAANETLEALLTESATTQHEVTDQLGAQVRRAVEVLVQALDRIDRDRGRTLLKGVPERELYDAALTVMMRLVFLFAAEERGLLMLGDPLYDQHYAVSTLRDQLREDADQHGEEILERRRAAWTRLLATFRAVHAGVEHDALRLPAYGGSLFDPDRFPFLEGRTRGTSWRDTLADPLPVHDRTVLHLLEALQLLQVKVGRGPSEAQRVSFRALDIEQIGHIYEGLLDHTARRADAPVLGLAGARGQEPEVPLPVLEEHRTRGIESLLEFLTEQTGRSEKALRGAVSYEVPSDDHRFVVACDNDTSLLQRVRPFAGLVREDTQGLPVVIPQGSVYVTQGSDRRATGTHYTPKSLTEPIVQYALEPLVYEGPSEGRPREQWRLKSPDRILSLRVCDMAMGSGAFLVQACRYLADRLVEAWTLADADAGKAIAASGEAGTRKRSGSPADPPSDVEEQLILARRLVTDRCLYGVDVNPMAVEMAKLSLWLVTLQKDRPFTFLDHALRCGDSLLGVSSSEQIEHLHIDPVKGRKQRQAELEYRRVLGPALAAAVSKRRKIESFTVRDIRDAEEKRRLLREAEASLTEVGRVADLVVGAALHAAGTRGVDLDEVLIAIGDELAFALSPSHSQVERDRRWEALRTRARQMLDTGAARGLTTLRPFHWPIEFPEVFLGDSGAARGFDAIVGNPPFMGGQKLTGTFGTAYRDYLVEHVASGKRGSADLCAYFLLRAHSLLQDTGGMAMLATNTIAQGDTREVGLEQLVERGCSIPRAVASRPWPGVANLAIAEVWLRRGQWRGPHVLAGEEVPSITPFLTRPGRVSGKPFRLEANAGVAFQGSIVLGLGFVLTPKEAEALLEGNPRNREVLFLYLSGEDLNARPDQSASRWVINFRDWPLDREAAPDGYRGPVASDFPECLDVVREKVRPERETNNRKVYRVRWWQYGEKRPELYKALASLKRVLVIPETTKYCAFSMCASSQVFSHMTKVVASDSWGLFGVLNAAPHRAWARAYCSTLETRLKYITTDAFETYPLPRDCDALSVIGERFSEARSRVMRRMGTGLTKTYNAFHNEACRDGDIVALRDCAVELDRAVVRAYGWDDLQLRHGFFPTKQGLRFTVDGGLRDELLDRLLALNHERHAEEVAKGLHVAGKPKKRTTIRRSPGVNPPGLFDPR